MNKMKIACASAALVCGASVHAQSISNIYSLGDSLSDGGVYAHLVSPGTSGRFTSSPGKSWVEYLAGSLGLSSSPANIYPVSAQGVPGALVANGGNNYAVGAAEAVNVGSTSFSAPIPNIQQQVANLLANTNGTIDKNALVTLWIGGNDVRSQIGTPGAPGSVLVAYFTGGSAAAAQAIGSAANTYAAAVAQQVQVLKNAGAKSIVVLTIPDLGSTPALNPAVVGATISGLFSQTTAGNNAALRQALLGKGVVLSDANKLFTDMLNNPGKYGFVHTNDAALCGLVVGAALGCATPNTGNQYMFADGIHPTAITQQMFADAAMAGLRAPAQFGTLMVSPMVAIRQHSQTLEPRLTSAAFIKGYENGVIKLRDVGDVDAYVSAENGYFKADSTNINPGLDARTLLGVAGADVQVATNALVGAAVGYTRGNGDFGSGSGSFKNNLTSISAYSTVALSKSAYLDAVLAYGDIQYTNVTRTALLGGIAALSAIGSTTGTYQSARIGGGYHLPYQDWTFTPIAALTYEKVKIKGYTENLSPISMAFGDAEYMALRSSLGLRFVLSEPTARLRPYGRVTIEHDLKSSDLQVLAGSDSQMLGTFSAPRPGRTFALGSAGVAYRINPMLVGVAGLNATMFQSQISGWSLFVGAKSDF